MAAFSAFRAFRNLCRLFASLGNGQEFISEYAGWRVATLACPYLEQQGLAWAFFHMDDRPPLRPAGRHECFTAVTILYDTLIPGHKEA